MEITDGTEENREGWIMRRDGRGRNVVGYSLFPSETATRYKILKILTSLKDKISRIQFFSNLNMHTL